MEIKEVKLTREDVDDYTAYQALSMAEDLYSLLSYDSVCLGAHIDQIAYVSPKWVKKNLKDVPEEEEVLLICMSSWYIDTEVFNLSKPDEIPTEGGCVLYPQSELKSSGHGIFHGGMGSETPVIKWLSYRSLAEKGKILPDEDAYKKLLDFIDEQYAYETDTLVEWYDYEVPKLKGVHPLIRDRIRELVGDALEDDQ
jgi:hypothetical protein